MIQAPLSTTALEQNTLWDANPFLVSIGAFAAGIFLSSFVHIPPLLAVFVLFVGLVIFLAEKVHRSSVSKEVFYISLLLASLGTGMFRYAIKDAHTLQIPAEQGIVISEPEDRENTRRFVYESTNGEKVLVNVPLYTEVSYGDEVSVTGKLQSPGIIEGENGERDFDYGAYLAQDDIYYTLSFAHVEVLSHGHGSFVKRMLLNFKRSFVEHTKKILPEPYAGLLLGLIVAGRDALPTGILEDFRRAGVVHIVVLSGYNITIIAEFLRRIVGAVFLRLKLAAKPRMAAGISLGGVFFFVLMTGAEATVVRAALMASVAIGATFFGRTYSASRALLFAGFLMLLENPKILVFNPSFQLSFLATLGLIYVQPVIERGLGRVTEKWQLRETLAQTIATQLTVLPLLIYSVGDVSLVSIPANLLILLIIPFTMLIGFIAVSVSYVSAIFAWPLAYVSYLLLGWILGVAHVLGSFSFATIKIPNIPGWAIWLVYLLLLLGLGKTPFLKNFFERQINFRKHFRNK